LVLLLFTHPHTCGTVAEKSRVWRFSRGGTNVKIFSIAVTGRESTQKRKHSKTMKKKK
jgi:hypothetical protein